LNEQHDDNIDISFSNREENALQFTSAAVPAEDASIKVKLLRVLN